MRTRDFDYTLPDDRIARTPVARGSARLLVLDAADGERHRTVAELPALLRRGDLLVVNDTRVLPARLEAVRAPGGGRVELLLLDGDDPLRWRAMARPAKKLAPGTVLRIGDAVEIVVEARGEDGVCVLRFSTPVLEVLESHGAVPLPPYLKRAPLPEDRDWYQTVYAAEPGAVAAPTAGLHLTREMLAGARGGRGSRSPPSRCTSAPAPSSRSRPSAPRIIASTPSATCYRSRPRTRSSERGGAAAAWWRSAPPWCGAWRRRRAGAATRR